MLVKFIPYHFQTIEPQPAQRNADLSQANAEDLARAPGFAQTCLNGLGGTLACAGLVELWSGRGMAWAILGAPLGAHMVEIVRGMKAAIDASTFHRVEMYLASNDRNNIRLAGLLGFHRECTAKAFLPDKRDVDVYTWIRPSTPRKPPMRLARPPRYKAEVEVA